MALIDYVTLPTMKVYVGQDTESSIAEDLLEEAITSASREVDRRCDRDFGLDVSTSTREFTCYGNGLLIVDDIAETTGLEIEGQPFDSDVYTLLPLNGRVPGIENHPYTHVKSCGFIKGCKYEVTARWGWLTVPQPIVEVTKMLAAETYIAKNSANGIVGYGDYGMIRARERAQIPQKLRLYSKHGVKFV